MFRILELIHDEDHLPLPSNIDKWAERQKDVTTRRHQAYLGQEYPDCRDYDLIIIHGGTQHLWNKQVDPWLVEEIEYIKNAVQQRVPVMGFCLGSQIIAEVFGQKVYQSSQRELGFYPIGLTDQAEGHPVLRGIPDGFVTFEWHSDHYDQPDGFERLCHTPAASNQVILHNTLPVIGFQFHPEYTLEIIREYALHSEADSWQIGRQNYHTEEFLQELQTREDTYGLFERLIGNVLEYWKIP